MRVRIAIIILALASLACGQYVPTVPTAANTDAPATVSPTRTAPTELPTAPTVLPTAANSSQQTAVVVQTAVNVRDEPAGDIVGTLLSGNQVVVLQCIENWCEIEEPSGWIWRGCLSDNPDGLGCVAK